MKRIKAKKATFKVAKNDGQKNTYSVCTLYSNGTLLPTVTKAE